MMDKNLKRDIESILNGSASVEKAQEIISRLSEEDLQELFLKEDLDSKLDIYRQKNNFTHEPIPHVSDNEKNELWQRIKDKSEKESPSTPGVLSWLKSIVAGFKLPLRGMPSRQLGIALASIIILVATPSILHFMNNQPHVYTGIKGVALPSATLKYAIVGQDNQLMRPDRIISENDILAFRIQVQREGFFSILMVFNGKVDQIIADKFLQEGTHDLTDIYHLEGNQGKNTLVFVSMNEPVAAAGQLNQLVLKSVLDKVPSLTINNIQLELSYQTIEIK